MTNEHRNDRDDDRDRDEGRAHDGDHDQNKTVTIFVNGRERTVTKRELSVDDLVKLAYDNPPTGELIYFTITYRRGHGNKPEGTLEGAQTVKVKEGMIFNVTATDKS